MLDFTGVAKWHEDNEAKPAMAKKTFLIWVFSYLFIL